MDLVPYNYFNKLLLLMCAYMAYVNFIVLSADAKKKRIWTREIFTKENRENHGFFSKVFQIIKDRDEQQFRKAVRMGVEQFNLLSSLLKGRLTKESPRRAIESECRLAVCLVYLSQGSSWQMLSWAFRLGTSTVRKIILETCEDIWEELHGIYLAPPNKDEWRKISQDFYKMTGLPNCVGAIDGKHIRIKCPPRSGSMYYNYKGYSSIVLLAACDSNYCFTAVDIGAWGSQSDGGVLSGSTFGSQVLNEKINFPPPQTFPNSNIKFPFYVVGDAAFPLRRNLMRPYPGRLLPSDKEMFNKTLSKARVRIENTFGIMTARWRVLLNSINCFPENVEKIIKAVVVLHNFVKMHDGEYCPDNFVDHFENDVFKEGLWRKETPPLPQHKLFRRFNAARKAFDLRDTLKDYINSQ